MTGFDTEQFERLDAAKSVTQCLQRLISADDFDTAVQTILEAILYYYKGERAYIFELDWKKQIATNTFEVCRDEAGSEKENLQEVPLDIMHFWIEQFKTKSLIQIDNLHSLGSEREAEFNALTANGIQSLIAVPFSGGEGLRGFLVVDDPSEHINDVDFLVNLTYFISRETEQQRLNKEIAKMNNTDSLTGLFNRHKYAQYKLDVEKRKFDSIGAIVVDINGLKQMNEAYGHDYGDIVIAHVAELLRSHFPEGMIFRMSGDEFIAVCENIDCDTFYGQVKKLRAAFVEERRHIATCG